MSINYQDKSLLVTYIQIFLRDYFGVFVDKTNPKKKTRSSEYFISQSKTIRVTGYHNMQTYSSLALYMFYNYPNEGYPYLWVEESDNYWVRGPAATKDTLLSVISSNMENLPRNKNIIEIPDRVISYVLGEVVSGNSSHEEILRVKNLIYPNLTLPVIGSLDYDEETIKAVKKIQQEFIDRYTVGHVTTLPDGYEGFKVTGYVDPWTEVIIKGGVE